ncbi:MAG TPA: hypothetical protein VMH20_07425 [Verrucomicrobiae bacterium]|nr:hypothetical protein [Verrucomicrobiae bacterium]
MMDEIRAGDFVVTTTATTVGLAVTVASGRAEVWWYHADRLDGSATIIDSEHRVSELKIVGDPIQIPPSMVQLRREHFGDGAFRTRLECVPGSRLK